MSVLVKYNGGIGNNIFQYVCGRLFARTQGLKLETDFPHTSILRTTPHEDLDSVLEPLITVTDHDKDIFKPKPRGRYWLRGFFQQSRWYVPRRAEILSFMQPVTEIREKNAKDVVAHLRLGDFPFKWRVHPAWFLNILSLERFDRLYLVTNELNEQYLSHFKRFDPIIVRQSASKDWDFIRTFDRILAPNSTYSWWASFFSNASRIYTHARWLNGQVGGANLSDIHNGIPVDGPYCNESSL